MRQFFGFLVVCFSLFLLTYLVANIINEVKAIETHKVTINDSVHMPSITTNQPIMLYDRNGTIFSEEYVEWRQPLTLKEIPQIARELFILSEDVHFYGHIGFDVSAIARALLVNSNNSSIQQGGSTITQQLVRMRYLTEEKSYERKLIELFYAHELEKKYDKDSILEMYLNEAYFSNQVYGIGGAATYYFSKSIHELTTAELAFIASIPNNPSLYDPLKNFKNTKARQERLLETLAKHDVISNIEKEQLQAAPIVLNVKEKTQQYPTYSSYVMLELRELIAKQEGLIATSTADQAKIKEQIDIRVEQLMHSGAKIYTALDPNKQMEDEQAINNMMSRYDFEASATVIDNKTREIVSVYGGKNYEKYNFHRAYQQPRQPGSAFKSIAAFAPYINETGYNENSIVSGAAYCVGSYCPSNYGGGLYGDVSLTTAFKYSYNTSALRLVYSIGLEKSFSYIKAFNFKSIKDTDQTYAATLGGLSYGVTTSELADSYTSFIDGSYKRSTAIRKVTDAKGNVLYSWQPETTTIWKPKTVTTMRNLLAEVVDGGTGKGITTSSSYVGVKTGTTNDYRDFWVAGLTANYTSAIWIGYDKGQSMERYENDKIHFDIFNAIMD